MLGLSLLADNLPRATLAKETTELLSKFSLCASRRWSRRGRRLEHGLLGFIITVKLFSELRARIPFRGRCSRLLLIGRRIVETSCRKLLIRRLFSRVDALTAILRKVRNINIRSMETAADDFNWNSATVRCSCKTLVSAV